MTHPATYAAQQDAERAVRDAMRRKWLMHHAARHNQQTEMADALGISPVRLRQLAGDLGVDLPHGAPGRKAKHGMYAKYPTQ
mgnify:CR=1 FL=1